MLLKGTRGLGRFLNKVRAGMAATPRTGRRDSNWSAIGVVVEELESRRLLTATPGNDVAVNWTSPPPGWTGPQTENPSVAMSNDGTHVVMVVADNTFPNSSSLYNTVRVVEYTNNGTTLTPVRDFVLESNANLVVGGYGRGPLVAMNGAGTQYVVSWRGLNGTIRGASVLFNGATVSGPQDIVAATNVSGTKTYTVSAPKSIAMRSDGTFVGVWDTSMVDTSIPGYTFREAQAQVFNLNLTTATPIIQELNGSQGESWSPVVAWTNHGNTATWDVAWTGTRPGSMSGGFPPVFIVNNGVWLQKYTFGGGTNTLAAERKVIARNSNGQDAWYSQVSLTNDPSGNVGMITSPPGSPSAPAHIWLYTNTLAVYPGYTLPLTTYNPTSSQMQAFGTIAFDAPGGGPVQHVLVGTQRYVEGPGATWGYLNISTATWTYTGDIHQVIGTQDMFPAAAINSAGNWWVFARQYYQGATTPPGIGWKIRAWDPPLGDDSDAPGNSGSRPVHNHRVDPFIDPSWIAFLFDRRQSGRGVQDDDDSDDSEHERALRRLAGRSRRR